MEIAAERPSDADEVEALYDLSFAPGRMALSSYRLRDGIAPIRALSLVARDEFDVVVGAIRYWPVRIGASQAPALLLGPVAVHPTRQGEGLGALLILDSLDRAASAGWTRALLVGDAPYYSRFGFSEEVCAALEFPPPVNRRRFLGKALVPGAFDGVSGLVAPGGDAR